MKCKRCGEEQQPGCYFSIEKEEDLIDLNMSHPDTVWLCYYDCYPKELRKQYKEYYESRS